MDTHLVCVSACSRTMAAVWCMKSLSRNLTHSTRSYVPLTTRTTATHRETQARQARMQGQSVRRAQREAWHGGAGCCGGLSVCMSVPTGGRASRPSSRLPEEDPHQQPQASIRAGAATTTTATTTTMAHANTQRRRRCCWCCCCSLPTTRRRHSTDACTLVAPPSLPP